MSERLALLVWAATPERPDQAVTPLVHALAARALDAEVEVHFAGPAVRWLVSGLADQVFASVAREKSVGDFLREVQAAGVALFACSMAVAEYLAPDETLLPGCRQAGATAFVARALADDWQTLTY